MAKMQRQGREEPKEPARAVICLIFCLRKPEEAKQHQHQPAQAKKLSCLL